MVKHIFFFSLLTVTVFFLFLSGTNDPSFVTIKLQGGVGNRLFQVAAAAAYAKKNHLPLIISDKYFKSKSTRKILHRLHFKKKIPTSNSFKEVDPYIFQPIPIRKNINLEGFFISKKYFEMEKKWIQELFAPSKRIKKYLQKKYHSVLSHKNCVGLHIRTFYPDYLSQGLNVYKTYPPPDLQYIEKALSLFPKDSVFLVCSDHIGWCKKNLKQFNRNFYFVENEKQYHDFYLLSLCKHGITSNSTFSWWSSFLNPHPNKKIIYRTPWVHQFSYKEEDLFFEDWIKIEGKKNVPLPSFDNLLF